jgi:hypothetical protein
MQRFQNGGFVCGSLADNVHKMASINGICGRAVVYMQYPSLPNIFHGIPLDRTTAVCVLLLCNILSVASDCSCPSVSFQVIVFRFSSVIFVFTDKSVVRPPKLFSLYIALCIHCLFR